MGNTQRKALKSALEWYVDHGVDEILLDEAQDRTAFVDVKASMPRLDKRAAPMSGAKREAPPHQPHVMLGKADARAEAVKLARGASTLVELKEAIKSFDGMAIKKTATNMVFADGSAEAPIMVIGEAPEAEEDRQGKPFVGASGQLLDRILAAIDLDRAADDPSSAVYLSNLLNWRPPGNRSPNPTEIAVSLPFIEKHIILAKPKMLILCGGLAAKSLLGKADGISRLRKGWHDWRPQTTELAYEGAPIPAIVTYHPTYLLSTPLQKRAVWADMLAVQAKRNALDVK